MSFNLINQLSSEDKNKIENYIYTYGIRKENFVGLDTWLRHWGVSKIKLYKLLGNQMMIRFPIVYEKNEAELKRQLDKLVYPEDRSSKPSFRNILMEWIDKNLKENLDDIEEDAKTITAYIRSCYDLDNLKRNELPQSCKFKIKGVKRTFQMQKKAKPIKALGKFISYCSSFEGYDKVAAAFEDFRIKHSMILNDNRIKANLVISIHPLDFMTMSDNTSNWHSCMSWQKEGVYCVGSVEMMNSNNVLCCYLEGDNSMSFLEDYIKMDYDEPAGDPELYAWTNKKWRQLIYCTKDIIVSGKSYPYANDDISKMIIEKIRELAKKNLNRTYHFGPERYLDMRHVSTFEDMEQIREYIEYKNTKKHNIIFDTKGMYNDMLNDHYFKYWCVRNKVNHNKIISYSGKTCCLSCGKSSIWENDNIDEYSEDEIYNERYQNVDKLVCEDCLSDYSCDFCGNNDWKNKYYIVENENHETVTVCHHCVNNYIRTCPDCGEPFIITTWAGRSFFFNSNYVNMVSRLKHVDAYIQLTEKQSAPNDDEEDYKVICKNYDPSNWTKIGYKEMFKNFYPVCACNECISKKIGIFDLKHAIIGSRNWNRFEKFYYRSKEIEDKEKWTLYLPQNLEIPKIKDGDLIKV